MRKLIYAGMLALTFLSLQACEMQSDRDNDPAKDAAHKRNHRADYAEKAQESH
ncbi:hypothetical protein [Adhaeribacter pallidiroseus]|uniref:Uncharacterized protein n=1 Tax=Adhaeribacter pallidiroseus TaxID=2072847 RepID=A0A369QEH6_9BACT|nr:hypothetical protein [Adhaeribacter pallidiroseus]RDC63114.1 hypothetical protein AHMF7616_01714 [Adhaeribacter pallidiroseus]